MNNINQLRVAWLVPSVEMGAYWQPVLEEFLRYFKTQSFIQVWFGLDLILNFLVQMSSKVAPQLTVVMLPLPFPVVVSAWVDVLGVWVQPKGAGGTLSSNSSRRVQRWSVSPAAMAGVHACHFRGAFSGAASRRLS